MTIYVRGLHVFHDPLEGRYETYRYPPTPIMSYFLYFASRAILKIYIYIGGCAISVNPVSDMKC